jgi:hypothetical protein
LQTDAQHAERLGKSGSPARPTPNGYAVFAYPDRVETLDLVAAKQG